MTKDELKAIQEIAEKDPWLIRKHLTEFIETVEIGEPLTRTSPQNRALHLWFTQIAQVCREAGVDSNLLMSKTMSVEVNKEIIKGMWKALQEALYGKTSTTQLKKTGEIDTLERHFVRFFADKLHLQLPPFPHEDVSTLKNLESAKALTYPEYGGEPTI